MRYSVLSPQSGFIRKATVCLHTFIPICADSATGGMVIIMQQIKCPNCGEVFQVDESGYAKIAQQVRDKEFEKELERREKEIEQKGESALTIIRMEQEKSYNEELFRKNDEIADKEREIERLKSQLEKVNVEKKFAISEAVQTKEKELSEKVMEITELKGQLSSKETERQLKEKSLKEQYEVKLKNKDEQIEYYKDFKARQSTKIIGESLEQHCLTQFNSIRMTAFPTAYFEKDNDVKTGSKGDFIFRESSDDGTEFISIMFEMKNEMDETATKHKNEDFYKELDKDRKQKNCEYAVLVSMLESDNELFNAGIVDVSYKYEKMYVVRPQCFIPIITLLRNAAMNAMEYKQELAVVRNQNIDISDFEEKLMNFKSDFSRNYDIAHSHFDKAVDEIDKTIQHLEKVKKELLGSDNQLRIANNKVDEVSIKKLTRGNKTMQEKFEELKKNQ